MAATEVPAMPASPSGVHPTGTTNGGVPAVTPRLPKQEHPFMNPTVPWTHSKWSIFRTIVMVPIAIVRLVLMFVVFLFAALYLRAVLGCCRSRKAVAENQPLSPCLRMVLKPFHWSCRLLLVLLGFFWISEEFPPGYGGCCGKDFFHGPNAPRIIVPSHHSFVEFLYFGSKYIPVAVAKAGLADVPCWGPAMLAINPILVPRSPAERARLPPVMDRLRDVVTRTPRLAPVLIFPEGTCSNTNTLVRFQAGAFIPGVPVTPVVLSFTPYKHYQPSWTWDTSAKSVLLRLVTQVYSRMHVQYLPTYTPSAAEVNDAGLYASNVQRVIADAGNKRAYAVTNYDGMLFGALLANRQVAAEAAASHRRVSSVGDYLLTRLVSDTETQAAMRTSGRHYPELVHVATAFARADCDRSGTLSFEEFRTLFPAAKPRLLQLSFELMDRNGDGQVSWGEVMAVVGSRLTDGTLPHNHGVDLAFELLTPDDEPWVQRSALQAAVTASGLEDDAKAQVMADFDAIRQRNEAAYARRAGGGPAGDAAAGDATASAAGAGDGAASAGATEGAGAGASAGAVVVDEAASGDAGAGSGGGWVASRPVPDDALDKAGFAQLASTNPDAVRAPLHCMLADVTHLSPPSKTQRRRHGNSAAAPAAPEPVAAPGGGVAQTASGSGRDVSPTDGTVQAV